MLQSEDRAVPAGLVLCAVKMAEQRAPENVVHERALAAAAHAGDARHAAEREVRGDVLQIVLRGADDAEPAGAARLRIADCGLRSFAIARCDAFFGDWDFRRAGEVLAGEGRGVGGDFGRRSLRDEMPAARAGTGAEVEHMVRGEDGVLVVLDDDDAVPEIAQPAERADEPVVVALVQADARFVEHVEAPREARADLRREPDALRLAAAERAALAVEREIAEAHLFHECEPVLDLARDLGDDNALGFCEREMVDEPPRIRDGETAKLVDVFFALRARDGDAENLRPQPRALATLANAAAHVGAEALARKLAVGRLVEVLQVFRDALERLLHGLAFALFAPREFDLAVARPAEHRLLELLRKVAPRRFHLHLECAAQRLQQPAVVPLHPRIRLCPRGDGAVGERAIGIGREKIGVDVLLAAEALARGACAEVAVEGKMPRCERGQRKAGVGIREVDAEIAQHGRCIRIGGRNEDDQLALAPFQRGRDAVAEPLADVRADDQAVHDGFDAVRLCLIEPDGRGAAEFDGLAIHPHAHETLAAQFFQHVAKLADFVCDDRREEDDAAFLRHREDGVHDFLRRHPADHAAGLRVVRLADRGVEDAEVVVNFRRRRDGRALVAAGAALLDGDGRGQALDEIHVRLLHLVEELPRVGGQALDVAALALGVERVEGERGLSRAAEPRDHDELLTRDFQRQVLQVVLAGASDSDHGCGHSGRICVTAQ